MLVIFFTVLLLALLSSTAATYGVDVSQRTYSDSFSCMKSYGYSFAVVRVYQSGGYCDPNGPATINDAWSGGMSYVDGYIFPCYSCGNPGGQIDETIDYLASNNIRVLKKDELESVRNGTSPSPLQATVGMLWLDIEGPEYWSSTTSNNVNFVSEMVSEGQARGYSIGIYSSASQWSPIMGTCSSFSYLPLWYAHYDNNPSFSDFSAFGGWTTPAIKQYAGTTSFCSASVDKNYY